MAIIKKYADGQTTAGTPVQRLSSFGTFLVDNNPNSTYFKITEFKDTFTGGKNGFLIEGSPHLMETTEIRVQILDVAGNPVYYEPGNGVPEYYEGLSKVVAVYVYQDTPIGIASITVLGELKTYIDEFGNTQDIPDEWKGVYNVKWEREFKINRILSNEDKVRFYKRPKVSISEIVKPIYSNVVSTKIQKGYLNGTPLAPLISSSVANFTSPTSYLLTTTDDTFWTASIVGTNLTFDNITYSPLVDSIVNSREIIVANPYVHTTGLVGTLEQIGYTASFNYVEGVDNLKTALTGSFAKISLTDLTTFVGDCARVKIFRKSQSDLSDYQFVQEIKLESNELLVDLETTNKNAEYYGIFDSTNYKKYWLTSSVDLDTAFDQTYLFDSIQLNPAGGSAKYEYFYTSASLNISEGSEYSLEFDVRLEQNISSNYYIRAFISGSRTTNGNTVQVEQNITTLNSSNALLQKQTSLDNIVAEKIDNAKLYFKVLGTGWHIANISFRAAQETAFSPDEITFIQSVPRSLPAETFLYRFEFYDINNNYIPINVDATKTFNGGNLQTIRKQLKLVPSAAGFQFDSGSNPVPPTIITIDEQKTLLTGSVHYTSQSFDFFGNNLSSSYTGSGQQFPGLLHGIGTPNVYITVADFTGSRSDVNVQLVRLTGECEGFTDTINIYKILDGFGGVNHIVRPYRGTQIRNSSTASLEIQAVRIDGINDIILSSQALKNYSNIQLHIISRSKEGDEKFVNLAYATASGFVPGLTTGSLGSKQINYNATFNRDSIDFRRIVYLMPSSSAASGPAYAVSSSVLASIILEDLQDGLDAGKAEFNTDNFTINPRTDTLFTPQFAFGTASFITRTPDSAIVTASFQIFPSMSMNKDYVPEYWMYYTTQHVDNTIFVTALDDNKLLIPSGALGTYVGSPLSQSKNLTLTFRYTEPWTSASISFDKTFTISPQGKPGDESIVFEITPANLNFKANAKGIVGSYSSSITNIRVKQGSRYLAFTGSVGNQAAHGTFHIAQESIISSSITGGLVYFDNAYTESLIISGAYNMNQLSASLTFPLRIHPYYTSSIYTQSIVQNFTKTLDGAPQIEVVISPLAPTLNADEVGYVDITTGYLPANTTIKLREGDDYLTFTTRSLQPGTWRFLSISGSNIQTGSLSSSSLDTATVNFKRFDYPFTTASVFYNIVAYPYSLGPGHMYTSSVFNRTQIITKSTKVTAARSVNLSATYTTVNFNKDGVVTSPLDPIVLTATPHNSTGSVYYQFFKDDVDQSGIITDNFYEVPGTDATGPGENATWMVKIRDGNNLITTPIRAQASLTISGIKAGADAYKLVSSNDNTTITADLWTTSFTGTGQKITTFKGTEQLSNVTTPTYNAANDIYDFLGNYIGNLGYSSASIFSKSNWITQPINKFTTNPAEVGDISAWTSPATNKSGQIVYKVDFENGRQVQFVTQSISVQFTSPSPYVANLTNENSSAVYRVSGEFTLNGTGNIIRAYRGSTELTNTNSMPATDTDAYGTTGLSKDKCRVTISYVSPHITLPFGLVSGSWVNGTPATLGALTGWADPKTNTTAQIVYRIDCEGRQDIFKTQSISVQYEGSTGPGIVMRGQWNEYTNYSGSVETIGYRRDAVIYPDPSGSSGETHYFAAISGSGPTTYNKSGTLVGKQIPPAIGTDNSYWQYLGKQDFFVAAKIAIFEESFVKNTINVGNNIGNSFANIVLNGGRPDPYMAIGQYSTIGYGNAGIWQGIYDLGAGSYKSRLSLVNSDNSRYLKWSGDDLEIKGSITVTGGDAATQTYATTVANSAGATAYANSQAYTGTAVQLLSGSLGAMAAINSINSGNAVTYIGAGAIVTNMVATNLVTSTNYSASVEAAPYSDVGTFIDLANGKITSTGFAVKGDGTAYFKGVLNSSQATFGAWTLDNTAFSSANGRVILKALNGDESISVLDSTNALRFLANTALTLPSPSAAQPTGVTTTGPGGTPVTQAGTTSTDNVGDNSGTTLHNLTSFTSSTNGGRHAATYTYNPANQYNTYAYANGFASAYLSITLVITDNSDNIIAYGTTKTISAYGTSYNYQGYYGIGDAFLGYSQNYLTDPSSFTVSVPNLTASTVYKLQLYISHYCYTDRDTSGSPYYESSVSYVNFQEPGVSDTIQVQATSAGTYINGGGFLSAVSGDKYLQVSDGTDGGALGNLTYSTIVKGNLNLVDGTLFSSLSKISGYGPAAKAFGTVIFNGGSATNSANYTVLNAYNVSTSVGYVGTYISYTITFTNPMPDTNYSILLLPSNTDYTSNRRTDVPMILFKQTTSFMFSIRALNNSPQYLGEGVTGGYVCFAVFDR
jgi:hypothetical protein